MIQWPCGEAVDGTNYGQRKKSSTVRGCHAAAGVIKRERRQCDPLAAHHYRSGSKVDPSDRRHTFDSYGNAVVGCSLLFPVAFEIFLLQFCHLRPKANDLATRWNGLVRSVSGQLSCWLLTELWPSKDIVFFQVTCALREPWNWLRQKDMSDFHSLGQVEPCLTWPSLRFPPLLATLSSHGRLLT